MIVWWMIPVILAIPAARCFAYYYLLNAKIAKYMGKIKKLIYDEKFEGYQNFISSDDSRGFNFAFNTMAWAVILGGSVAIAIWHKSVLAVG